jgi:hypothetical protein
MINHPDDPLHAAGCKVTINTGCDYGEPLWRIDRGVR